jgi:hypothetical protein
MKSVSEVPVTAKKASIIIEVLSIFSLAIFGIAQAFFADDARHQAERALDLAKDAIAKEHNAIDLLFCHTCREQNPIGTDCIARLYQVMTVRLVERCGQPPVVEFAPTSWSLP